MAVMKRCALCLSGLLLLIVLPSTFAAGQDTAGADPRPGQWAVPVAVDGVPNLFRVSDTLYRSAQPSAGGMRNLAAMGIKTIVNLRAYHSDRDEIQGTGLAYEHIRMNTWHPREDDLVRFLKIASDTDKTPLLVHCQHGADRTGTLVAVYRMAVQGWKQEAAIEEMTQGGFGFHAIWVNLVPWIRGLDIEKLKSQAGLSPQP